MWIVEGDERLNPVMKTNLWLGFEWCTIIVCIPPPSSSSFSQQFLLTPHTQAHFRKIDEEFDHMLRHNQMQAMPVSDHIHL